MNCQGVVEWQCSVLGGFKIVASRRLNERMVRRPRAGSPLVDGSSLLCQSDIVETSRQAKPFHVNVAAMS